MGAYVLTRVSFSKGRLLGLICCALVFGGASAAQRKSAAPLGVSTLVVRTQPNAVVWLNDVRCGVTDAMGALIIRRVPRGAYTLRVRARGFKEKALQVRVPTRGPVRVILVPTDDEAELAFQQAEELRERAKSEDDRRRAAELYRQALRLRPRFAQAHVGLARVAMELGEYDAALEEINAARRVRPIYPEASAVEGRIMRATGDYVAALAAYRRAIREGRGFQPEAYTGMGLIFEDQGKYEEAAASFKRAIAQLFDTEPALYQLLGAAYEKMERYKEAIAAYEKYLELAPNGSFAPAIRSIIEQLRQQAAGKRTLPF